MILNRRLYSKISLFRSIWNFYLLKNLSREKIIKTFKFHELRFQKDSPELLSEAKRVPRFTGNKEKLLTWKESKICEKICPTQAIKVSTKNINIDYNGCIACGLCLDFAPAGVLEKSPEMLTHTGLSKDKPHD